MARARTSIAAIAYRFADRCLRSDCFSWACGLFRRRQPFVLNDQSVVSYSDGSIQHNGDYAHHRGASDYQGAASDDDSASDDNNNNNNDTSDDDSASPNDSTDYLSTSCRCSFKLHPAEQWGQLL